MSFPGWVWLFFGSFGTMGAVLFTLVVWTWFKVHASAEGWLRSAARWNMLGLMFLFVAAYFACGIGGPPGSLLSKEQSVHDLGSAYDSAILSIVLSVPGWACVLVGMRKLLGGTRSSEETSLEQVVGLGTSILVKLLIVVFGSFAVTLGLYELAIRRISPLRGMFGMKPRRRGMP